MSGRNARRPADDDHAAGDEQGELDLGDDDREGDDDDREGDDDGQREEPKRVPVAALEAERKKREAAEARAKKLERQQAEATRRAAEEAGEYERLYGEEKATREQLEAEIATLREREEARVEALSARNRERLRKLPKDYRALVPEDLDADRVAEYLDRVEAVAEKATRQPTGSRAGGATADDTAVPEEHREEVEALAKTRGHDAAWWWKNYVQPRERKKQARA